MKAIPDRVTLEKPSDFAIPWLKAKILMYHQPDMCRVGDTHKFSCFFEGGSERLLADDGHASINCLARKC